jgi:hypothetical protein
MARAWRLRQRESAYRRDFRRLFNYVLQETLPVAMRMSQRQAPLPVQVLRVFRGSLHQLETVTKVDALDSSLLIMVKSVVEDADHALRLVSTPARDDAAVYESGSSFPIVRGLKSAGGIARDRAAVLQWMRLPLKINFF